jgi:hypothetical protein
MRPVGAISRIMGFAIAVAAFVGATHIQAAPQQNEAVVRGVRGTANYSTDRGSNWKDLKVGTKLRQNSIIRTAPGGQVDLYLGDNGPVVRVTENTTLGIDRLSFDKSGADTVIETQLDLRAGRILGNVKHLAAASKYEVKTPQGVAGIRGTRYDISADGRVRITQGDAVVVYVIGGRTSTVNARAGQMVSPPTTAGGNPVVAPIPPAEMTTINGQIDQIGRTVVIPGEGGQQTILTVTPIIDALQKGDRAKVDTEFTTGTVTTPNNNED